MKILLCKGQILRMINEQVHPLDVTGARTAIESLVNKRRNVGWINEPKQEDVDLMNDNEIQSIKVPSNPYDAYVIYLDGHENEAKELKNIAERYKGFLSPQSSDEETQRIGRILSYPENEIEEYIKKRNYIETI